jgi:hypothetical protein
LLLDGAGPRRLNPVMLAIMGPSGAGFTPPRLGGASNTIPNSCIARYMNGVPVDGQSMIPSAFIQQEVAFFFYMTVKRNVGSVELKLIAIVQTRLDTMVLDLIQQLTFECG